MKKSKKRKKIIKDKSYELTAKDWKNAKKWVNNKSKLTRCEISLGRYTVNPIYHSLFNFTDILYAMKPDKKSPEFALLERMDAALGYYREAIENEMQS